PHGISLSFNGGKDCTVILFIYLAVVAKYYREHPTVSKRPLRCLYITSVDPFVQVDEFVEYCEKTFELNIEKYQAGMKEGLEVFLSSNRSTQAIIIGTRSTDPHGHTMAAFQPTDGSWPKVMRIHPILDWTYEDIWRVLIACKIPYCCLYDQGCAAAV
ncbi:3'-phosphoadenosine 5'-phosphosulfate sulfotransferase, partial [Kappamyces sp. JEL0680]